MRRVGLTGLAVLGVLLLPGPLAAPAGAAAGDGTQPEQRYVVTFDPGTPASTQDAAVESTTGEDGRSIGPRTVSVDATSREAQALAARSDVQVVETDVPVAADAAPNDPCYAGPGCPVAASQVGMRRIHSATAWGVVSGAATPGGVVVGIIDTGVAPSAPELPADVRVQLVPASSCPSVVGTVDDSTVGSAQGHGTMVAGIVGAMGDNATGVAGVVPGNLTIRSYKVLNSHGSGTADAVAGAIDCAIRDHVDVINLSLTVTQADSDRVFLHDAVTRATNAGIVVVAAAGNQGSPNATAIFPASYPEVVGVAAVGNDDRRASFSNGGSWVDLAAPGVDVLSTIRTGGYGTGSGTSFATPFVSGAAALVLARDPSLSVAQVRARLEGTAEPLVDTNVGRGLVDLSGAVRFTVGGSPACSTAPGYLLDGWGGVHSVGGAPVLSGVPYWPGWDIARDIATAPGLPGAYVLDGWGGVHPTGGAPGVTSDSYWGGWDIARAVARRPDGQGVYVLDGWGGVHLAPTNGAHPTVGPGMAYWRGWDIARDVAVDPTDSTRGFTLDGWGGVHPFGFNPPVTVTGYTPGRDIARRLVVLPSGTAGYVLDANGRLSPWATGSNPLPPPIAASTFPYGPGRGVDVLGTTVSVTSGYGTVEEADDVPCTTSSPWQGWDIIRSYAAPG